MADKSIASLSVVPVKPMGRVDAPAGLTAEEKGHWDEIVNSMPADWFSGSSVPVLVEYVRAKTSCDLCHLSVAAAMAGGEPKEIESAMKIRDMESRRLVSLATKLRLTQQSRYTPKAANTAAKKVGNTRPWDT